MTVSTDTYTVTHDDGSIELSREERKALTYLVNVVDGEVKSSNVKEYLNLSNRTALHRLKERMTEKGLIETREGEADGPIHPPLYWRATDHAHDISDAAVLVTDEMTLAERVTLVEQELNDVRDEIENESVETRLNKVASAVSGMQEDIEEMQEELRNTREQQLRQERYMATIKAIMETYGRWPDDIDDFNEEVFASDNQEQAVREYFSD